MVPKIDFEEINKIIKLLEEKNLAEFELEVEGFKIKIARKATAAPVYAPASAAPLRPRPRPPPTTRPPALPEPAEAHGSVRLRDLAHGRDVLPRPRPQRPAVRRDRRPGQEETDALHRRSHEAHERDRMRDGRRSSRRSSSRTASPSSSGRSLFAIIPNA